MAASRMTVPSSVSLGNVLRIRISRDSSSYLHQLSYQWESSSASATLGDNIGTSYDLDTATLREHFASISSDTMHITCFTYDQVKANIVGWSHADVIIYASGTPVINSITVTPINENTVIQGWDDGRLFVQGYTKLSINVNCTAPYGANIATCRILVNGQTVAESTSTSFVSGTPITDSGTVVIAATVSDTRNNTVSGRTTINVQPYSRPYASAASVLRYSSDVNTEDKEGTNISAKATIASSSVNGNNVAYVKVRYKQAGSIYPTDAITLTSGAANHKKINSDAVDKDISYVVQFIIYDKLNTESGNPTYLEVIVPTHAVTLHSMDGGSGLGVGGYQTKSDAIQLYLDTYLSGRLIFDSGAAYGTNEPTSTGASNGQVYFQLID